MDLNLNVNGMNDALVYLGIGIVFSALLTSIILSLVVMFIPIPRALKRLIRKIAVLIVVVIVAFAWYQFVYPLV